MKICHFKPANLCLVRKNNKQTNKNPNDWYAMISLSQHVLNMKVAILLILFLIITKSSQ